jgi:hypothetical protein
MVDARRCHSHLRNEDPAARLAAAAGLAALSSIGHNVTMASPGSRIPTFNRSAYLRSLLGYLAARRFEYPIRVLDSSSGDSLSQNRETVGRGGLDIVHQIYGPAIPIHKKIELGISLVESTYCFLCADDDVLFTDELNGLFEILDANPALVVAHGYYVNFKPGEDFDVWYTDYSAPSIVADDAHGLSHSAIHAPRHDIPTNHRRDLEHLHPSFRRSRGRSKALSRWRRGTIGPGIRGGSASSSLRWPLRRTQISGKARCLVSRPTE